MPEDNDKTRRLKARAQLKKNTATLRTITTDIKTRRAAAKEIGKIPKNDTFRNLAVKRSKMEEFKQSLKTFKRGVDRLLSSKEAVGGMSKEDLRSSLKIRASGKNLSTEKSSLAKNLRDTRKTVPRDIRNSISRALTAGKKAGRKRARGLKLQNLGIRKVKSLLKNFKLPGVMGNVGVIGGEKMLKRRFKDSGEKPGGA